jgi:hypothetical protein
MNVIAAAITAPGDHMKVKHFTIDTENNITVHASRNAARDTGAGVFATEIQFADLIGPDNKRLVAIWNSLSGVKPVSKFMNRKVATERIWKAIQGIGQRPSAPASEPRTGALQADITAAEAPTAEPSPKLAKTEPPFVNAAPEPTVEPAGAGIADQPSEAADTEATVGTGAPNVASPTVPTTKTAKKAPKTQKAAKPAKSESGPRAGSKTAQVVAMLQRKNGATLAEIMTTIGWQKHTVAVSWPAR